MSFPTRRLHIRHVTRYTYDRPVARSTHRLHLKPITDWRQHVVDYKLTISQPTQVIEYEDVFGNPAARFEMETPFTELTIAADQTIAGVTRVMQRWSSGQVFFWHGPQNTFTATWRSFG